MRFNKLFLRSIFIFLFIPGIQYSQPNLDSRINEKIIRNYFDLSEKYLQLSDSEKQLIRKRDFISRKDAGIFQKVNELAKNNGFSSYEEYLMKAKIIESHWTYLETLSKNKKDTLNPQQLQKKLNNEQMIIYSITSTSRKYHEMMKSIISNLRG